MLHQGDCLSCCCVISAAAVVLLLCCCCAAVVLLLSPPMLKQVLVLLIIHIWSATLCAGLDCCSCSCCCGRLQVDCLAHWLVDCLLHCMAQGFIKYCSVVCKEAVLLLQMSRAKCNQSSTNCTALAFSRGTLRTTPTRWSPT